MKIYNSCVAGWLILKWRELLNGGVLNHCICVLCLCLGYSALFKHPNDVLNYCVYIIPGNPKVTPDDLPHWHEELMRNDPNISRALGKDFKIERMKAGLKADGSSVFSQLDIYNPES